jgi:hypothetical protein
MHNFTRDTWTVEDTEANIRRMAKISNDELLRSMEAGRVYVLTACILGQGTATKLRHSAGDRSLGDL